MELCLFCSFESIRKISQILKLIKHLEAFIEKSNLCLKFVFKFTHAHFIFISTGTSYSHSAIGYEKLIEKIEGLSRSVHLILVEWTTTATIVSPLLVAFINFFILGMGNDSFHFDGKFWFPLDVDKPVGFFLAALFQYVSVYAIFCCFTPIGCIMIGSCWSIVTFLKDVAMDISHLRKKKITNLNEQKLTERLRNFVRFHADVEELSELIIVLWGKQNADPEIEPQIDVESIVSD